MLNAVLNNHKKSLVLLAIIVFIAALAYIGSSALARPQEEEPEPPVVHMQPIDITLMKSGITVQLQEVLHSPELLSAKFSFHASSADTVVYQMLHGVNLIRQEREIVQGKLSDANGLTELSGTKDQVEYRKDGADEVHAHFILDTSVQDDRELMTLSLGSYIVGRPDISSNTTIKLGDSYKSLRMNHIPGGGNPTKIPLESEMTIGERVYDIREMLIFPQTFRLVVVPANEAARSTPLGVVAPSPKVTVNYEDGSTYKSRNGITEYDNLTPRGFASQQFIFAGPPPPITSSSMTLAIRGGSEIVGPFVFEDVPVVAEEMYRIEYTPPPADTPATPTPVSPSIPTATPEPTPEPTPLPSLAVQNLRADEAQGAITLTWDVPDSDDVLGYEILRQVLGSSDVQTVASLNSDATSYVDSDGLQSGTGYAYTVRTNATGVTEGNKAYIKVQVP